MRSTKQWYDMEGYLDHCLQSHGPGKMLMVITDLEDAMCEKGMRAQWRKSQFSECDLLLFTEMEMNLLIRQRLMAESQRTEAKLNQIKCILQERVTDLRLPNRHIVESCRKHLIGIVSKSAKKSFTWLKSLFTSAEKFKVLVQDVRLFHNVNVKDQKTLGEISRCTFLIVYHSKKHGDAKITDVSGALYTEELEVLSNAVGKENTIVVIDDMVKSCSAEKMKLLQDQRSIQRLAKDLFLFGVKKKHKQETEGQAMKEKLDTINAMTIMVKESKSCRFPVDERKINLETTIDHQPQLLDAHAPPRQNNGTKPTWLLPLSGLSDAPLQKMNDEYQQEKKHLLPRTDPKPDEPMSEVIPEKLFITGGQQRKLSTKHIVGIFSRSPQRDYYWLRDVLQEGGSHVQEIRHGYMMESGSDRWMQVVPECTFGILYHKKTTGKLHITDVPGSLYDKELRFLSEHLGRENVFVIVDDVEDPSSEKTRILEKQPSINQLTRGLEIFGHKGDLVEESSKLKDIIKLFDGCRME
ncbi:uncharacterized protein [Dendropsophus ebraccatus]|uniref:uncharacterized protein n=1 Tax=Dendropsophus ebraccatus TaxID=150705 RepID=UPI003830FFAE